MVKRFLSRLVTKLALLALIGLLDLSPGAYAQVRAYVANFGSDNVSVIDTSSNSVIATVAVGSQPQGLVVTPDGRHVYVANCGGDVFVIDTSSNKVATRVVVGGCPTGVAITPNGARVYVTRANANSVWVIDTASNTVVAKMAVGTAPGGVAITPDGTRAYVANVGMGMGSVSVIDTSSNSVVSTVNLGSVGPVGVAITSDGRRAYVLNGGGGLSVIDTSSNTLTATVSLPGNEISPFGLAFSPDGTRAYVIRFAANSVAVVDTASNTTVATVGAGGFPNGVAVSPDGAHAYVAISSDASGLGNGAVSVIDTSSNTVVGTIVVGTTPFGLAFAAGSGGPALPPHISSGGIVPGRIEPGEWVSIYGSNLATGTASWMGEFPTTLGGTSVTIDGNRAYLSFVSPTQINLQVPNDAATGAVPVVVTTAAGTASSTATLAAFSPSFFLLDATHVAGIILRSDGSGAYGGGSYDIVGPTGNSLGYGTVAAKAGDIVELFGTGFGPTNPAVGAGQAYSGAAPTTNAVTVRINNVGVTPSFAGLSGAGLYQINVAIPAGLGTGDVSLQASVGGAQTSLGAVISLR